MSETVRVTLELEPEVLEALAGAIEVGNDTSGDWVAPAVAAEVATVALRLRNAANGAA